MSFSDTFDPNAPSAVTGQGSAISNREDLTDVLSILAPEETPILSSAQKQSASSTFVEWSVDKLADPSTSGVSEGADVTAFTDKFASRARLGNYVQKFRRDYMVSDLQEAVDSVGPAKVAQAEVYDGSCWTSSASMNEARSNAHGKSTVNGPAILVATGNPGPPGSSNVSEEYTGATAVTQTITTT